MTIEYRTPMLLQQILLWEKEFSREVEYLDTPMGLFLGIDFNEKAGYFCTPVDSFPFARTGVDGIHYALLTNFGLVKDLDEAPVIQVSPMDSDRIQLVARNLHDFFSIHLFDELALLNDYPSEEAYLESVRKEEAKDLNSKWFDHHRWKREKEKVLNEVQERFNLKPIPCPVQYLQEIRFERSQQITTLTEDSLGILTPPLGAKEKEAFFASIRNLQHTFSSDRIIIERHANELLKMGRTHEAESLLARLLS
ncbi:hypothetical protein [Paenibacillus sp. ATY16]|uniref:hypothetical protein n=1 Tax=Paenibacillus sp. ATY16 TaxID=1759312 RepID=UPI000E2EA0D2|nr:hypothetical protein [Paenibacillus sp. ATY16]MCK9861797.1 hypothetical protein [Paenibacillus sp. ATY16]